MVDVKAVSAIVGKIEDFILLKPDVAEFDDDGYGDLFHFSNSEACAEAFKMCDFLAKITKDNMNGWEMYSGSVGNSDAVIFTDKFSSECHSFTFYEHDLHTACEMANRYYELAHADESEDRIAQLKQ